MKKNNIALLSVLFGIGVGVLITKSYYDNQPKMYSPDQAVDIAVAASLASCEEGAVTIVSYIFGKKGMDVPSCEEISAKWSKAAEEKAR